MQRRAFIRLSSGTLAASYLAPLAPDRRSSTPDTLLDRLRRGPGRVVPANSGETANRVIVTSQWDGAFCRATVSNQGKQAVRIKEVILCDAAHNLPDETLLYGDSFQMLSQTGGTLGHPQDLGYSEARHYKIPGPESADAIAVSGLLTLSPPAMPSLILAFTSCRRFIGRFFLAKGSIQAVVDTESLELAPGETWEMEELMVDQRQHRPELLAAVSARVAKNHARRLFQPVPTGWCSWYCFGPRVTAEQVLQNLDVIAQKLPGLKYVQIDDGYQAAMGDWLETGKAFGGDLVAVLKEIRKRGFEPAIWVAPFIAEQSSRVFQQRPEWFIRGADDKPLLSSMVTFGGWRHGPWFALDGTHPEVQQHFRKVFSTMRQEWGCSYFKLDANFWGAMHGGRFHDPKATRIQAYRRGMEAIRSGAGDGFILGCNHPIWPSFGLIDGSRSSADIKRAWPTFRSVARQTLNRNWQNGRLWWNDPDAVLLTGDLPDEEFLFHATAIYASGGMVLSGDDLTKIPPPRQEILRRLLPPTGIAAEFENENLQVGFIRQPDKLMVCLFNWDDAPATVSFSFKGSFAITDYWSSADLGRHSSSFAVKDLPGRSARLLVCR
ncbi:MAG TPA: glycoside hydrolase family 36 protein [Candidatus Angelobacter sp.]|nr:glycoside hydrolase family 36 protein [Candidatus Angelobacter sp.]